VSDAVTVMRYARVGQLPAAGASAEQLAELMVGRAVKLRIERHPSDRVRQVRFSCENVTGPRRSSRDARKSTPRVG